MRYIFFFSWLLLMSCGRSEFTLDFDLKEDITDNYNVTYFATDINGGITVQAVASVRDGKCLLNGATKKPTLVYITARRSVFPVVVYVKKGEKIEISGDEKEPLEWKVGGEEINRTLTEWRQENLEKLTENQPDSVNGAVRSFVELNPDNPASTILMQCYFNRGEDERGYLDLMASLRGRAREQEWLTLTARTDQLFHTYSYPARLESLVMRANNDATDTLKADGNNPMLLMFWQTGYSERKNMTDSLKALKKELPDTTIIIADVCIDIDSIGWRSAIRRDSLDFIKRFWAPMSLADPAVMKLRVKEIPYFIVFDKEGQQQYRGGNLSEALKDYRRLVNSKDS